MSKGHPYACYISNGLTVLMSIALLIAASVLTSQTTSIRHEWTEIYSLSIYSLVISILGLVFSAALTYVVYRKLPALTSLFTALLVVVVILNVICVIVLAVGLGTLRTTTTTDMDKLFSNYSESNTIPSSKVFFGYLQRKLKCCGVRNPDDWKVIIPDQKSTPDSCCHTFTSGCGHDALTKPNTIYDMPCNPVVFGYLRQKYVTLIVMNCILFVFLAASSVFGFLAERTIRQQYESM